MSIHPERKDITCKKCEALFVIFKKDFNCPNCGRLIPNNPKINMDFIPDTIGAMLYHKKRYGNYRPDGWYIGSMTEHLMGFAFDAFDLIENKNPKNPKKYLKNWVNKVVKIRNKKEKYLIKHVEDVILEMLKIYQDSGFEKYLENKYPDRINNEIKLTLWDKIKKRFFFKIPMP
ncbi:hypothetical protein K8R66_03305 [bacterium]|nr:hypothetical protein [bacterium]